MTLVGDAIRERRCGSEKSEKLRCRIIDVAVELFIEQGYDKTTTRQIIQKAGILNGSLYHIFKNKEEIFSAAITEALWEAVDAAGDFLPDANILMRLGFPILLPVYIASESKDLAELLARAGKNWDSVNVICDAMTQWIRDNDTDGLFDTHAEDFRFKMCACIGAQSSIVEQYSRSPGALDPVSAMTVVAGILLDIFGIHHEDLRSKVSSIYDVIVSRDITICGIVI